MLGNRNCGKSVLVDCFQNSFGGYIGTTNANNLLLRETETDLEKSLHWLVDLEWAKIAFTNEVKLDANCSTKLDGNMIKKVSSGGDRLKVRQLHKNVISIQSQMTFFLMSNDIPLVEPKDAMQTLTEFQMECIFVDKPHPNSIVKERKADLDIKDWLREPHVINAF